MIDLSKYGSVVGAMQYGNTVEFYCESLDGNITDSRQISLFFNSEETATAVAKLCNQKLV
jgi:hypothetical protein